MSIVTKRGDTGRTGLMYDRRVPKCHPRVEAYGCVDELNAALGIAKAAADQTALRASLTSIQNDLVVLMGELATAAEDMERYVRDGFRLVSPDMAARLEQQVADIEAHQTRFSGWATPGATHDSAALDLARTICRRTERRVCELHEAGEPVNAQILVYLNRLADLLWLFARSVETPTAL